ncbi:hypothetical protein [Pedobacter sp.]|jgi:hypothetical protein|uniref:hypothetical protein n=1 Tax=Pedobacter sp. TaxID=1411316 RepID=UPI002CF44BFB|nr:hypothetical protein [Pedobacter sp.]HWW38880.1 hypothetical protein [Pedobacter sp.]
MKINELALSFCQSKTELLELEKDLALVEKLVKDLLADVQTPDLKLEISGLNKEIKSQTEVIEQLKAELNGVQDELLACFKAEDYKAGDKLEVVLNNSKAVQLWVTKDGILKVQP